jgi:hypothetical protein
MSREKWEKLENLRGEKMAAAKIFFVKKKSLHFALLRAEGNRR